MRERSPEPDALAELPYLTEAMLVTLGKAGIKTLDDLAEGLLIGNALRGLMRAVLA